MVAFVLFYYQCSYLEKFKSNQTMPIHQMFVFNFTTEMGVGEHTQNHRERGMRISESALLLLFQQYPQACQNL